MSPATLMAGSTHALEPYNVQSIHTGAAVQWQDDEPHQAAGWFESVLHKLHGYSQLSAGWDSYRASPVNEIAIAASTLFAALVQSLSPSATMPSVAPTSEGYVQFEWRSADLALEVEIQPSGGLEYAIFRGSELFDAGIAQPEAYPRVASLVGGLFA